MTTHKNGFIRFDSISKSFGSVQALADVSFSIEKSTIHGIVGENGAGKSTAMKILFGLHSQTNGQIFLNDNPIHFKSPSDALQTGIGMIHQHFMLASPESGLDNILLEATKNPFSFLNRGSVKQKLNALIERHGLELDLTKRVQDLSVGEKQRLEILKLLYRDAKILILDEPTAVLTPQEVDRLFSQLRSLKHEGKTVLIITHKLKEIKSLTDRVTVFKRGKVVGTYQTAQTTVDALAVMMVGEETPLVKNSEVKEINNENPVLLNVQYSECPISIKVCESEIVGIAGVEGNGQKELMRELLGVEKYKGISFHFAVSLKKEQIGIIPEDRQEEGLLMGQSMIENFLLGIRKVPGIVSHKTKRILFHALSEKIDFAIKKFDIRPTHKSAILKNLSGGNQQKVIFARESLKNPKLFLISQPTRGVDIGASALIHQQILNSKASKTGVLLISSEIDEIMSLSDRIYVLYRGKPVAHFVRNKTDERELGLAMGGVIQ